MAGQQIILFFFYGLVWTTFGAPTINRVKRDFNFNNVFHKASQKLHSQQNEIAKWQQQFLSSDLQHGKLNGEEGVINTNGNVPLPKYFYDYDKDTYDETYTPHYDFDPEYNYDANDDNYYHVPEYDYETKSDEAEFIPTPALDVPQYDYDTEDANGDDDTYNYFYHVPGNDYETKPDDAEFIPTPALEQNSEEIYDGEHEESEGEPELWWESREGIREKIKEVASQGKEKLKDFLENAQDKFGHVRNWFRNRYAQTNREPQPNDEESLVPYEQASDSEAEAEPEHWWESGGGIIDKGKEKAKDFLGNIKDTAEDVGGWFSDILG